MKVFLEENAMITGSVLKLFFSAKSLTTLAMIAFGVCFTAFFTEVAEEALPPRLELEDELPPPPTERLLLPR